MDKLYFLINSLDAGGAERQVVNISQALSNKYKIKIITLQNLNFYKLPENVEFHPLTNKKTLLGALTKIISIRKKIKSILIKEKPTYFVSSLEVSNFLNILFNKGKKIISFEIHLNQFKKNSIKNVIYRFLIKKLYKKADKIKVNSLENKIDLSKQLKIKKDIIKVVHNPFNFEIIKKETSINKGLEKKIKNKKIFVTVGRFVKEKSFHILIKGFYELNKKFSDSILLIVGYGPEKKNLVNLTEKLKLSNKVIFLGKQKNVFKYLKKADYFIYSSSVEGFPNVLVEATAMKLPIITSNFKSGATEVIDPELGYFKIKTPHYGPNGVILDLSRYEKQMSEINLNKVKCTQKGIERFKEEQVIKDFEELIKK